MKTTEESVPFLVTKNQPDLTFQFSPVNELTLPASGVWMVNNYYISDDIRSATYYCSTRECPPYSRVSWNKNENNHMRCDYLPGSESQMCFTRNIIEMLALESLLLRYDGLLLHASLVRCGGKGILFTAPSGTGKSTQAELWKNYTGAEILNGDRAALRKRNGIWEAWGSPYAGSSGIYRNETAPVSALVVLRQANENRIHRVSSAEAMRFIYPELTLHRWDSGFVSKAVDLFLDLIAQVPVFLLQCLPNEGAVRILETQLMERG